MEEVSKWKSEEQNGRAKERSERMELRRSEDYQ